MAKVYVGNLSYQLTNEGLAAFFEGCGTVKNATIIKDRETGRSKGFGFVEFDDASALEAAIALSGSRLDGRPVRVSEANERPPRRPQRNNGW